MSLVFTILASFTIAKKIQEVWSWVKKCLLSTPKEATRLIVSFAAAERQLQLKASVPKNQQRHVKFDMTSTMEACSGWCWNKFKFGLYSTLRVQSHFTRPNPLYASNVGLRVQSKYFFLTISIICFIGGHTPPPKKIFFFAYSLKKLRIDFQQILKVILIF